MRHQLALRKVRLCRLAWLWKSKVGHMRSAREVLSWGPSAIEMRQAGLTEHSEAVEEPEEHGEEDDDVYESYTAGEEDEAEVAEMEAAAFEEAELWVGQELAWTADEFALTEQHSLPARYDGVFGRTPGTSLTSRTPRTPRTPRRSHLFS